MIYSKQNSTQLFFLYFSKKQISIPFILPTQNTLTQRDLLKSVIEAIQLEFWILERLKPIERRISTFQCKQKIAKFMSLKQFNKVMQLFNQDLFEGLGICISNLRA